MGQRAALQPQLPQPARGVEHVGMHVGQAGGNAVHHKARGEQRRVKGAAVEGAQHGEAARNRRHRAQKLAFLPVIPHEHLLHAKAAVREIPQPHQKRHRARASCKARGFRIQKQDILRPKIGGKGKAEGAFHHGRGQVAKVREDGKRKRCLRAVTALFLRARGGGGTLGGCIQHAQLAQKVRHQASSSFRMAMASALPRSPTCEAGPTQLGQPDSHPQPCAMSSACSKSSSCIWQAFSLSPTPPG